MVKYKSGSVLFAASLLAATAITSGARAQSDDAGTWQVEAGGYVRSGSWQGYAWTAVDALGSTFAPADFSGVQAGESLCVSGTIAPDPAWGGFGILGVNLNQPEDAPAPGLIVPTGDGLWVDITDHAGSALRIDLVGAEAGDPSQRWCVAFAGSGFYPFASFNTTCWDNSGAYYAGEPLSAATIVVPGNDGSEVPFDFCLDNLVEAGDGSIPMVDGNLTVESGYVMTAGDWQGYAWTATDPNSSIVPSDLSDVSGTALCVAGSVAAAEDYSGFAMLGVELNQGQDGVPGAVIPTEDGLLVAVENLGGSELRVHLNGPNGASDPNDRWCAPLDASGFIPWAEFNTECWSGEGSPYVGQPIQFIAILVPGSSTATIPFSFCLKDYAPFSVPSAEGELLVEEGYVTAHKWHGYAWTAFDELGTTMIPSDLSDISGTALCAAGEVAASPDYAGFAMLGVELNQSPSGKVRTIVPSSNGLLVDVENLAGSPLRVQIHGPDADVDPNDRWCADLEGSGEVVIPWREFNTECWSGQGTAYSREPLESVSIVVPGGDVNATPFSFCLKEYAPYKKHHAKLRTSRLAYLWPFWP